MLLSIATTSIPGHLFEKLEAIAEAGFKAIELHEPDFNNFDGSAEDVNSKCEELDLSIALLQPFPNLEGQADQEKVWQQLEAKFKLMQALETDLLLITSAQIQAEDIGETRIISDLKEAAKRAQKSGVRLAYMALPWSVSISSDNHAMDVVAKVNHPNFGLALNSYFSLTNGKRPADLHDIDTSKLFHVQLSDAPRADIDLTKVKRHFGLLPGVGRLNLEGFVRMLARHGYNDRWSIARIGEYSDQPGALKLSHDAYRSLVAVLNNVAITQPELNMSGFELPPMAQAMGFEFIEFSVNRDTYTELTDLLKKMSFRCERKHISKAVELWRQGAINIVVNRESQGFSREAFLSHGAGVCDMGLRVKDAEQTVKRANALGTQMFIQPLGAGELKIPAIHGVGGSVVHFIDQQSDLHHVWDIEFNPVSKTKTIPPAGLRRIDHVAQTMAQDEMQSSLLYYTTTFDMGKSKMVNVEDPAGLVRSQALQSPEGEIRLNLNGVKGSDTFAGSFLNDTDDAGVQHIAMLTDDIFETSKRLEEMNFPRLEIPQTYYDDLAMRYELPQQMLNALRAGSILFERNENSEYFQIYSHPIFNGFFFEIVERRFGYDGYGASNAPVRLVAQREFLSIQPAF